MSPIEHDFAAFIRELKAKRPAPKAPPPAPAPAPLDLAAVRAELAQLCAEHDPAAVYSDDFSVFLQHEKIGEQIKHLAALLAQHG